MSDINTVTIVGRLTRDPEVRHTSGGLPIVNLGIAVNANQKQNDGTWGERGNFFDVKFFGDRYEKLAVHLEKGKRVGIVGRLDLESWETDGQKRYKVSIIGNELQFLDISAQGSAVTADTSNVDTSAFVPVGAAASSEAPWDEIPF